MNKSDLVDRVAGAANVGKQHAETVIDALFDAVRTAISAGDRVGWPGFGSFSATDRKARTGRNPRTGEPVEIAASRAVKFTPGLALKDFVKSTGPGAKKKAAAKKSAAPAKKAAAKKAATKAPAKKAAAKKAATKSPVAKKTAVKKATAKKSR